MSFVVSLSYPILSHPILSEPAGIYTILYGVMHMQTARWNVSKPFALPAAHQPFPAVLCRIVPCRVESGVDVSMCRAVCRLGDVVIISTPP